VPHGTYGRIAPRSGLAWKNFIDVGGKCLNYFLYQSTICSYDLMFIYTFIIAGVIDEDYRGNVGVLLFNHSDKDFTVNPGDRVAQLICEKIVYPELKEFKVL
jgi:dUTP pyrophosphatase